MSAKKIAFVAALLAGAVAPLAAVSTFSACAPTPTEAPLRSLERSGRVAFVCLDAPTITAADGTIVTNPSPGLEISACALAPEAINDGGIAYDAGPQIGANLFALVTQTTRGEVALVNLSTGNVVDEDPAIPGANFLPVGTTPTDIVSTPKGTASFVSVAQVKHEGIFALPAPLLRPGDGTTPPPTLSRWPACALPTAPGRMIMISDPASIDGTRATCDAAYGPAPDADAGGAPNAFAAGNIDAEGRGRQKLVVTLPALGGVAVIDAQDVLDRSPGSFDDCTIERWIPLSAKLPPPAPPPPPPQGEACVVPRTAAPFSQTTFGSRPAGITYGGGRLYVADLVAPVIHVLDMATPCSPQEVEPLLPTSVQDPTRIVTTSQVSIAPDLTVDKKRFLYAIDRSDLGSVMVFDVTPGASRTPVRRSHPERNPSVPVDRIKYASPARDVLLAPTRDVPIGNGGTGVAPIGTLCDPISASTSLGRSYETAPDYSAGAGPNLLRGTFAFILLESGRVATIDIDDYDAPCRVPSTPDTLFGCSPDATGPNTGASLESSCNVIERHAPRSAFYVLDNIVTGLHEPGIGSFPLLADLNGSAKTIDLDGGGGTPLMVATIPPTTTIPTSPNCAGLTPQSAPGTDPDTDAGLVCPGFGISVAGTRVGISKAGTGASIIGDPEHVLLMNLEDPRAHTADQNWTVAFEGALPSFAGKKASLQPAPGEGGGGAPVAVEWLVDPNSRFCGNGVHSAAMAKEILTAQKRTDDPDLLADYVQINSPLSLSDDPYWNSVAATCSYNSCTASFGSVQAPEVGRDFEILEAYDDHLVIQPRQVAGATAGDAGDAGNTAAVSYDFVKCCFPSQLDFNIRGGSQWIVTGDQSGFLHHVISSPIDGTCRDSCDSGALARMNGRVSTTATMPVLATDPSAFINPMFRFAIVAGPGVRSARDDHFTFSTQGSFAPQTIALTIDNRNVDPQSIIMAPTGELAIADGALQGLLMVNPSAVNVSRQFF